MVYRSPETMKEMNEVLERIVRKFSSSKKMLGLHNEGIPPQASPPGSAGLSSAATAGKVAAIVEDTASNYQEAVATTPTVHARATLVDQPSVLPPTPELSPHGKASNKALHVDPLGRTPPPSPTLPILSNDMYLYTSPALPTRRRQAVTSAWSPLGPHRPPPFHHRNPHPRGQPRGVRQHSRGLPSSDKNAHKVL